MIITKGVIIPFVISAVLLYPKLPSYATNYAKRFKLNIRLLEKWSFAESTHCKFATEKGYYGRYNIGKEWLEDYMRWTEQPMPKNIKKYLENDRYNCFISYYSCRIYLDLGYSYAQFFQIWLWGWGNYVKGRWSWTYHRKIFGVKNKRKRRKR